MKRRSWFAQYRHEKELNTWLVRYHYRIAASQARAGYGVKRFA